MDDAETTKRKLNNPFTSLRHKNFRYFWIGMCVSLIGTWMQNVAQPWLAYSLTKSPILLSLITALQFTPVLLFSLVAGVIIDKLPKKKILILTQSCSMIITLILAILVLTGSVVYWHIVVLSFALGLVNTFDMPTRQAFVIELAGKEDLMNAIALNSSVFNLARVIGPAVAGLVMGYMGIAFCFLVNSVSFGAVLISLSLIKPNGAEIKAKKDVKLLGEIKDGLSYIFRNDALLDTLITMLVVGTFAMNFSVLVPVFSKEILHHEATGFGFLMSFMGVGSFIGAMMIAAMSRTGPKKLILNIVPLILGVLLILTGITNVYILTGLCLSVTGFFFVSYSSTANSTMQLNSKDEYRGRVMSVYSLVFSGSTPIGNIYAGVFTGFFGARAGFGACGAAILLLLVPLYIIKKRRKSSYS